MNPGASISPSCTAGDAERVTDSGCAHIPEESGEEEQKTSSPLQADESIAACDDLGEDH